MLKTFLCILRRDLLLAMRNRADLLNTLAFFILVVLLFPLGIGADSVLLRKIAPGILWVTALLATQLGLERLFAHDHADGTLEQMLLAPEPLPLIVSAKIAAHCLSCGLPLVVLAPLLALQFDLPFAAIKVLCLSLLLGTPLLSLIGAVGAALTLGLRGARVLLSLLTLPLYIPVLIFGSGAVEAQASGLDPSAHLFLLGGLLAAGIALSPWVTAQALKIALD